MVCAAACAVEYFALDLIMDREGACRGITALCMEDGTIHRFQVRVGAALGVFRDALVRPSCSAHDAVISLICRMIIMLS